MARNFSVMYITCEITKLLRQRFLCLRAHADDSRGHMSGHHVRLRVKKKKKKKMSDCG